MDNEKYTRILRAANLDARLSSSDKMILTILLDRAQMYDAISISYGDLAHLCGRERNHIKRNIIRLTKAGYINSSHNNDNTKNTYTFLYKDKISHMEQYSNNIATYKEKDKTVAHNGYTCSPQWLHPVARNGYTRGDAKIENITHINQYDTVESCPEPSDDLPTRTRARYSTNYTNYTIYNKKVKLSKVEEGVQGKENSNSVPDDQVLQMQSMVTLAASELWPEHQCDVMRMPDERDRAAANAAITSGLSHKDIKSIIRQKQARRKEKGGLPIESLKYFKNAFQESKKVPLIRFEDSPSDILPHQKEHPLYQKGLKMFINSKKCVIKDELERAFYGPCTYQGFDGNKIYIGCSNWSHREQIVDRYSSAIRDSFDCEVKFEVCTGGPAGIGK